MKKVEKHVADSYFRARNIATAIYLVIWFAVSYGVVLFAEPLSAYTINGIPFHYFMGAQGSVLTFILLLFVNAIVSDKIDQKYGIDEKQNEAISAGHTVDQ
ncbi:DUF4212 domain-containing protein [Pontibacillus sp. HMF3514]|uniref:DUF4212 domain-containing protein n=1 Tax=Pontibacillus sp. HMF3514 TaxID=2692425 RepID=UPI00131F6EA0|nr:DUF4212 domain-containing protein [Pontibacillus sp. HMF3514]QHE51716.1 DUF4212 domain-containing protein [Pontibacillus sp. HMF3514]